MAKTLLLITLLVGATVTCAQELLFNHQIKFNRSVSDKRQCYPIVDEVGNNIFLVLLNHKTITTLLLKTDYTIKAEFTRDRPTFIHELIGHSVEGDIVSLFFTTIDSEKITVLQLNFNTGEKGSKQFEISGTKQRHVISFSHKNCFYVLHKIKSSNTLILYSSNGLKAFETSTFDLSGHEYTLGQPGTLADALETSKAVIVENDVLNPLNLMSSRCKIFKGDSSIRLTIDNEVERTVVIDLPLCGKNPKVSFFNHSYIDCSKSVISSANSFVYKDLLYQYRVCHEAMVVTITNLYTQAIAKSFTVLREQEINFRNTEIIQEGAETDASAVRELSKTKQFLRKCALSNAAISVYPEDGYTIMIVGSYRDIVRRGPGSPAPAVTGPEISTPMGVVTLPAANNYVPVHAGYTGHKYSKAVYFKSKLDPLTLAYLEGEIPEPVFKRIENYSDNQLAEISYQEDRTKFVHPLVAETVFKKGANYLHGYYNNDKKQFELRSFK